MDAKQKRGNAARDLARTLTSAKYHYTTFSPSMERMCNGDSGTFPCVMIEPTSVVGIFGKRDSETELKTIKRLVKGARLPVLNSAPLMQRRIEIMAADDNQAEIEQVNDLIAKIKNELAIIELTNARGERAKKSNKS
jgi:hypothetical protein